MDFISSWQLINALWIVFGLYWLVSALKRKKTKQRETWSQRFRYVLPLVAASCLLVRPEARYGWLGARFVPASPAAGWSGALLTAAGVAVAFWARWHLGANWSGVVTLKEEHELIRTGPYRTIRHPIYTGILLALLGTVVATGGSARVARSDDSLAVLLRQGATRRILPHAGVRRKVCSAREADRDVLAEDR